MLPQLNKTTGLLGTKYRKFILSFSKMLYLTEVMTLTSWVTWNDRVRVFMTA